MAEILITLGILGVVIAMTLPSVIGKYQKSVTVNRLRETGLDAGLNTDDNSIVIKANNETDHIYEIDYDNFKISKIE